MSETGATCERWGRLQPESGTEGGVFVPYLYAAEGSGSMWRNGGASDLRPHDVSGFRAKRDVGR